MRSTTLISMICAAIACVGCDDEGEAAAAADAAPSQSEAGARSVDAGVDAGKPPVGPHDPDPASDAALHDAGIFANATEVELVQAFLAHTLDPEDAGIPADVTPGEVTLALRDGRAHLTYIVEASCGEPFDALMTREGDEVRVLLRSRGATACGSALYRMRVVIDDANAATRATVYAQRERGGAFEVGTATASGAAADCTGLPPCSSRQPCDREGPIGDFLVIDAPPDIHGCATLDVCGASVCIDRREACMMTCGTADCSVLESYPVQVRCDR